MRAITNSFIVRGKVTERLSVHTEITTVEEKGEPKMDSNRLPSTDLSRDTARPDRLTKLERPPAVLITSPYPLVSVSLSVCLSLDIYSSVA